jgi:hypothetical protein
MPTFSNGGDVFANTPRFATILSSRGNDSRPSGEKEMQQRRNGIPRAHTMLYY